MMKAYLSEYIGTFFLVFCGTGAIVINEVIPNSVGHIGIAITFGLIVMALIYSLGDISGAHFNPAVSLAFAVAGLFPLKKVIPYWLVQVSGALSASLLLRLLFPVSITLGATMPALGWKSSLFLEIVLSFLLMLVILRVATGSREKGILAGVAIGGIILLEAMFAGPVCGASMNPARSFAPAMISRHTEYLWIYLTAPFAGTLLALPFHLFVNR